jgi:hypothetical protein
METIPVTPSSADCFDLRPLPAYTTQGDLLEYIARTRRQLDRFEQLPSAHKQRIEPAAAARIRAMCDELEADIFEGLATD